MNWLKYILAVILLLAGATFTWLYKADLPRQEVDHKYSNSHSQFLTTQTGARIHYRDEGKPNALPLVLIHGSNASLHSWIPWVQLLGDDFRIITLDLPAHGLTGQVPDGNYSVDAFLQTIDAVADHLGLAKFVLGGNSMGGGVAWRYTLAHPQRVMAMILVDATGLPQWHESGDPHADNGDNGLPLAFELLQQPWLRSLARHLDPAPLVKEGLLEAYNHSPVIDDALIQRYRELALRAGTREATIKRFASYVSMDYQGQKVDLSAISQPTLVLWGQEDVLIPVVTASRFYEALPDARLVTYEHAGHMPMEEFPERSAADVRIFLQEQLANMLSAGSGTTSAWTGGQ